MFFNKYKDIVFDLPDADNNTFYVGENRNIWVQWRDGGWTIFSVCDVKGVNDKKLAEKLSEGIIVEMPEPDSKRGGSNDCDGV